MVASTCWKILCFLINTEEGVEGGGGERGNFIDRHTKIYVRKFSDFYFIENTLLSYI